MKQEFNKLLFEQKRRKEVVKHIQIYINKRKHYESYHKNPNDKIYMMMNLKDKELVIGNIIKYKIEEHKKSINKKRNL